MLFVKNMVCDRCKMMVEAALQTLHLHPESVELGTVRISEPSLTAAQHADVAEKLAGLGFEILDDRRQQLVERIKTAVITLIHHENEDNRIKHSEYLAEQAGRDYAYLSRLFSEEEGLTIEHYIIRQKTERVKELLSYGEFSLSEIAWQMGYSSVAALSAQFKKVTGITPSAYRLSNNKNRHALDRVGKTAGA